MPQGEGVRFSVAGTAYLECFSELIEPLGLTPARSLAMSFIHDNPRCQQNAVAKALNINKASVVVLIDRLEELDYVTRDRGADSRTRLLQLSVNGFGAFRAAQRCAARVNERVFGWMEDAQRENFFKAIGEITVRAICLQRDVIDDRRQRLTRPALGPRVSSGHSPEIESHVSPLLQEQ